MTGHGGTDELFDVVGEQAGDRPVEIVLRVHVQPGAGRTSVVGRHGDSLKLKVGAPPEGGRANEAVAVLLANTLGVGRDAVALVSGASSRSKRFRIGPVNLDDVRRLLGEAMAAATAGNAGGRHGVR
jgi:uncharacterized protein (TIGR00251 family)